MAKPITPTPILKGLDAKRFHEAIKKNSSKIIAPSEIEKIKSNAKELQSYMK